MGDTTRIGISSSAAKEPIVLIDEMKISDPVHDRSPKIEYDYYKCGTCGHKVFAGAMDVAVEVECTNKHCVVGEKSADNKTGNTQRRGTMRRYHYEAPRPVE